MKEENKDIFELMIASHDNEEQFPVLRAFQSYLDAEREKARKRQSQITICFLVCTILLVVCFCVVGFAFFSKFIEKDNQLTQLLLLERAGLVAVPQQQVAVQPIQKPVAEDNKVNELSDLIAELKKEREALAELKADIVKKQKESEATPVAQPIVQPTTTQSAPTTTQPVLQPTTTQPAPTTTQPVVKVEQEKKVKPKVNKIKPKAVVATTTTTTTSTTTTTTTIPEDDKPIVVAIPKNRSAESVAPKGFVSESMKVVTENNVYVPWHILLPDAK